MTQEEARQAAIRDLMKKADAALAAAFREHAAGDLNLAMNRVYYACFYAASAVLLKERLEFARHAGVRAAIHRHLVRPGRVSPEMGTFYDQAFRDRQEADYGSAVQFDPTPVLSCIEEAKQFVSEMRRLLGSG